MKYYDENDIEIEESQIDFELGHATVEEKVVQHHEAEPGREEKYHYEVNAFYFEDGTSLEIESQDDPHIKVVDPNAGVFEYVNLKGENKVLRGIDLKTIVDQEAIEPKDAWDEVEQFYRWHPFTEEEIAEREAAQQAAIRRNHFLETGPERLSVAETDVANLGVDVGDLSVTLVEILENL